MVLLALGSAASAVYPAEAPANNAIFIHGKDVKQITVYAWERDGALFHAFAGDGQEIPADAAKYLVRRFQFPGGQFREIYYAKGVQIQPHATHNEDIISYTLSGRRAQIVNDRVWEADAGDFLYYPAGSIHHGEALLDSVNVEIGVAHPDMPGDEGAWVSGNATSETPVAEWLVAGKSRVAYGADAARAPAGAAHYTVKKFNIGRYAVDEVYMPKGTKIAAGLAAVSGDEIMYMVKGRQRVTVGNTTDEAAAGDAVREVVGQLYASEALEDSIYIALVLSATSN
jgi:quercetin dioxygenase-like cupin family protein